MSLTPYIARINAILGRTSAEGYTYLELMAIDDTRGLYDDVYVVHYDFEEIGELHHSNIHTVPMLRLSRI